MSTQDLLDKVHQLREKRSELQIALDMASGETAYPVRARVLVGVGSQGRKYGVEISLDAARPYFRSALADVNEELQQLEEVLLKVDEVARTVLKL